MKSSLQSASGPGTPGMGPLSIGPLATAPLAAAHHYELRFQSLFAEGRAYAFPCDAAGHVDLDALSDRARHNYLYARAVVGREVATPLVRVSDLH